MKEGAGLSESGEEKAKSVERWEYGARFKHYLYRIGQLGNEGVEPINNFPARIELNESWHSTLNRMWQESKDGFERHIPVGYRQERENPHFPQEFILGTRSYADFLTTKAAKEKYGIEYHFGNIHSHPADWLSRILLKPFENTKLMEGEGFSLEDVFHMVNGRGLPMEVLVERKYNIFAFRTQETKDMPADSPLLSEKNFTRYWYRKNGLWPVFDSRLLVSYRLQTSVWKINIMLADAYKLALYRGKRGEDLIREFP